MSVFTEYWKLKEIIVWNVLNFNLEKLDNTFKVWYWENLKWVKEFDSTWSVLWYYDYIDYKIDEEKLKERKEDMDNFALLLEEYWVKVRRPDELLKIQTFKTPYFFWVLTPVTNPRDRIFVYWNNIIETPAMIRKRYFENNLMYNLFQEYALTEWYNWISAPYPSLNYNRFDSKDWKATRDYENFDKLKYDIAFDAAQILKVTDKDLIFNVTSYNHENWAIWLQKVMDNLWTWVKVHKVYQLDDNHIDWVLMVLKEWVFLVNNDYAKKPHLNDIKSKMPEKFKGWKYIYIEDNPKEENEWILDSKTTDYLKLCSIRWSFTNVLPLDDKRVFVNKDAVKTIKVLEKNWFETIPVQFRHSEIFWWWLHCATLDIKRD